VGYLLKEAIEKSPDLVQAYVNACYRAQQWIRRTKDEGITDLLWKPYMETFKREVVLYSVRYYPLRPARQDRARLEHRVLQPLQGAAWTPISSTPPASWAPPSARS
jgi:ABC-type nitrate/sulfonate/bicarbonate transport system substrate-binding protein